MSNDKAKAAKMKAVRAAMKQLEKQTKQEGIVQILGEQPQHLIETTSSGSLMLDIALGNGGFPKGRVIELFGAESSGKTLIATKAMAEVQKAGGICALIDAENAFDPAFARKLGLEPDELIVSQPETMEQSLEVMIALVESGGIDMIVLDSVAALVPKAELEAEVGKATMALQARILSPFLRRLIGAANKNNCTCVFINQIRDAVGVMYGDPTTTPGGKALKFYASVRCQVSKVGGTMEKVKIGGEEVTVGHQVRVKCVKNKTSAPFRKAEFMIYYDGRQLNKVQELADVLLMKGMIPRYKADGTLDEKGRNFRFELDGEVLDAKKRDDVYPALEVCPKIQEYFIEKLKSGEAESVNYEQEEDEDMTEDEFEASLAEDDENEAEEVEGGWDNI
jgi:recombination protein RecA